AARRGSRRAQVGRGGGCADPGGDDGAADGVLAHVEAVVGAGGVGAEAVAGDHQVVGPRRGGVGDARRITVCRVGGSDQVPAGIVQFQAGVEVVVGGGDGDVERDGPRAGGEGEVVQVRHLLDDAGATYRTAGGDGQRRGRRGGVAVVVGAVAEAVGGA